MAKPKTPANETAAQRFIRLANIRAGNAVRAIDQLGRLVGSNVESTPDQHKKLMEAIEGAAARCKAALAANKPVKPEGGIL